MSSSFSYAGGDSIHAIALEDGVPVSVVQPVLPGDEPAAPDNIPMPQVCSALSQIIDWVSVPENPAMAGGRAYALKLWLNPTNARHKSLREIAGRCDISRAALSKALLHFRDQFSIGLTIGRLQSSREIFREAQLAAVQSGTHSSFSIKKNNPHSGDHDMDEKVINTLDRAKTEILRLEGLLADTKKPQIQPQPTPSLPKSPPPKLESLSLAELEECMKICNRRHDSDMMKTLLDEWHRRKGR